ncbi:hypothetical protein BJ170DRAFT_729608 [Xylariales sp. AK1849]|nr:hypothetical protein BJ170DRAFT_729608 [Xylariales sp. AK1849]
MSVTVLTGTEDRIYGPDADIARPEEGVEPKALAVITPEVFGWKLKNTRALADNHAKRAQVLVYLPDFVDGSGTDTSVPSSVDSSVWYHSLPGPEEVAKPRITEFFQRLRSNDPPFQTQRLKIGVAGFCWGGCYTVYLAKDAPETRVAPPGSEEKVPPIECAFTGHPSLLTMSKDIEAIKSLISVANGPDNAYMGREKMMISKKVLEAKEDNAHEVVVYDGAKHGLAVRGDPNDPKQAQLGAQAEDQAVNWFKKHLH